MKDMNRFVKNNYVDADTDVTGIVSVILNFLVLFMPMTLAKRVASIILIVAGLPISRIKEMTGLTERSVRSYGKVLWSSKIVTLVAKKVSRFSYEATRAW